MKNIKSKDFKDSMEKVEFKIYKDLSECIDSLLFPKETVIAELNCEIENTKINVCLDVFGEVRIFYKDELYLDSNDFPEELKNIIKQGLLYEHKDVYVDSNNWFDKTVYINDEYFDDSVFEGNLADYTEEGLKLELLDIADWAYENS